MLVNKRERTGLKYLNDSKAFIEYSDDLDNICKNIGKYNPNKKTQNTDCIWWYDYWYA